MQTVVNRRAFICSVATSSVAPATSFVGASSSRMPALIAAFQRLTRELDAIDYWNDPFGWDDVAQRRCRALEELLNEKPATVGEFSDKFEALIPFSAEDTELTALRILAADIAALSRRGRV
jgi:hypothetical protein